MNDEHEIRLERPRTSLLKRFWRVGKLHLVGKASYLLPRFILHDHFGSVNYFCCFVGHGRSGGTLVGALLNAHPNVVMSNELNAVRLLGLGMSEAELYRLIYLVSKRQVQRGSKGGGGYSYQVSGQWQGRHGEILVIGDRKAGATAFEISRNPAVLDILERKVHMEKRFVHVARNPFDNIATTYKKTLAKAGETPEGHLEREISNYFGRCEAVRRVESHFGRSSICYVSHEKLIEDPSKQIEQLCRFLKLQYTQKYLRDCASIVKRAPSRTRYSLDWPEQHMNKVLELAQGFHWLSCYRFED